MNVCHDIRIRTNTLYNIQLFVVTYDYRDNHIKVPEVMKLRTL